MKKYFFLSLILLCLVPSPCLATDFDERLERKHEKTSRIEKVLSTDSFLLEDGRRIRLIGLKSPEAPKAKEVKRDEYGIVVLEPEKPTSTIEEAAHAFAKSFLEKKNIRLEYDIENKDENFYTLAYGFLLDGTFINAEILRQGYAHLKIMPPNTKYADILRQAYQEARREKRGLQGD